MTHSPPAAPAPRAIPSLLLAAGLLTGVVDGLFSSVLSVAFYHSTVARLFQGVAATLLGPAALEGGARTAAVGVAMHFGVAFTWSALFLALALALPALRRLLRRPYGPLAAAAGYGPLVWLVMSLVVIPLLLHRPTTIGFRWWVQLIGHIPFVGLPMAWTFGRGLAAAPAVAPRASTVLPPSAS